MIPSLPDGILSQSLLDGITATTGVAYSCAGFFNNPAPTWAEWESPAPFRSAQYGWIPWLAASPAHRAVMSMDLIPQAVSDTSDPLTWEQACASGDYDQYATALAEDLVSAGGANVVIRLGTEANGNWEADYVGTSSAEMSYWAKCFDNEVTAMRAVAGAHFLFVWNPNICTENIPLSQWYPGNAYVDIVGADAYDKDCYTLEPAGQDGWNVFSTNSSTSSSSSPDFPSLANIEAFAVANGKPMAFPEWGLSSGDDPTYVTDMGRMFMADNFSFESYFDKGIDGVSQLGSSAPEGTAAYGPAFN